MTPRIIPIGSWVTTYVYFKKEGCEEEHWCCNASTQKFYSLEEFYAAIKNYHVVILHTFNWDWETEEGKTILWARWGGVPNDVYVITNGYVFDRVAGVPQI